MWLAQALVWTLAIYALLGLLFALAFAAFGVTRVDTAARGAGRGFRFLLVPGAAALWPLLARRWWQSYRAGLDDPPVEHNAHRIRARTTSERL